MSRTEVYVPKRLAVVIALDAQVELPAPEADFEPPPEHLLARVIDIDRAFLCPVCNYEAEDENCLKAHAAWLHNASLCIGCYGVFRYLLLTDCKFAGIWFFVI